MANIKISMTKKQIGDFLKHDEGIKEILLKEGHKVAAEAQSTASDAENGAGGTIDGYAAAGFSVDRIVTKVRQWVLISSNADPLTAEKAQFHTQRRDGIAHLRAALYKFTTKSGVKTYPTGKNYSNQPPKKNG